MCLNLAIADPAASAAARQVIESLTWPHRVFATVAIGFDKLSY